MKYFTENVDIVHIDADMGKNKYKEMQLKFRNLLLSLCICKYTQNVQHRPS